jgi:DNA-binding XRE family transcriptional regulator
MEGEQMGALIEAKIVNGRKIWYVWGDNGNDKWQREYPQCRSKREFYGVLRAELGLRSSASNTDVFMAVMHKNWTEKEWVDDFSLRLRVLREEASLTQAELAEKAGLSVQAIAALEQGTRGPTWDTVRRLAYALKVGEEEFKVRLSAQAGSQVIDGETR